MEAGKFKTLQTCKKCLGRCQISFISNGAVWRGKFSSREFAELLIKSCLDNILFVRCQPGQKHPPSPTEPLQSSGTPGLSGIGRMRSEHFPNCWKQTVVYVPVQFIMSLLPLAKCSASTWFLLQPSSAPQVKCKRVLQVLKQLLWESVLYRTAISGREPAVAFLSSVPWGRSLTEGCPQHLLTCLERRVCVAALLQSVIHHGPAQGQRRCTWCCQLPCWCEASFRGVGTRCCYICA